jgi:SAM-dependent methyltransferase
MLSPQPEDRILDLGGGDGRHFGGFWSHREKVYIADIRIGALRRARNENGFRFTVLLDEDGQLPFPDLYFDIVFCNSVIEHVAVPKQALSECANSRQFVAQAWEHQQRFANEVRRVGKKYFVQTPNKYFPLESHTLLPFVQYLPRRQLLRIIHLSNRFWLKGTSGDFCLLTKAAVQRLFPDAYVLEEKFMGMTKSLIAVRAHRESLEGANQRQ